MEYQGKLQNILECYSKQNTCFKIESTSFMTLAIALLSEEKALKKK